MKTSFVLFIILISSGAIPAQFSLEWEKSFGGSDAELGNYIMEVAQKGYLMISESKSNNGDVSGNHGEYDFWLVRMDTAGNLLWQKTYGGSYSDRSRYGLQLEENNYVIFGDSYSDNGDVTAHHGSIFFADYWLIKTDSTGNIIWEKSLGGTSDEWGLSVLLTNDKGFILSGNTRSNDGDVTGNHGGDDYWIVKTDSNGNIQ